MFFSVRPPRINLLFRVTRPTVFFHPTARYFFIVHANDYGHDRLGESRASVLRVSVIVWSNPIESGVGVLGVESDHTGLHTRSGWSGNGLCRFWTAFTESLYDMCTFCVLHPCFVRLGQRCSDHTDCSHSIQIRQSMTPYVHDSSHRPHGVMLRSSRMTGCSAW